MILFPDLTDLFSSSPQEACSAGHKKPHVMEKHFVNSKDFGQFWSKKSSMVK